MVKKKEAWQEPAKGGKIWAVVIVGLAFLGFLILLSYFSSGGFNAGVGNIALIEIKGIITGDGADGLLSSSVSSKEIIALIEKADKNMFIKAIILEINSPGGSAVASAEVAEAVQKSQKPVVAVIREVGASGAYWIASATDRIYAHPLSMTGSIGVIGSYLEFAGLLERYNVTYRRLVAGDYKDTGNPYKRMTEEEQTLYQQKLDAMHAAFIDAVAKNRNLDLEKVRKLATGFVYLGGEAITLNLIDELGGVSGAEEYIEGLFGIKANTITYKKKQTLTEILSGVTANQLYKIGIGIGEGLFRALAANSYPMPEARY